MYYVRQGAPKGLGHAVLCAAEHVGDAPFAVLLGDDLIDRRDPLLQRMIEVRRQYGGSVVALMEVEPDQVSSYGCAAIKPTDDRGRGRRHRPGREAGPGGCAVQLDRHRPLRLRSGDLRRAARDAAGPRRRDPAHRRAADAGHGRPQRRRDGGGVHGVLFRGRRYDTGNKLDYLRTQIQFACDRPDVAPEFVPWLRSYLDNLP